MENLPTGKAYHPNDMGAISQKRKSEAKNTLRFGRPCFYSWVHQSTVFPFEFPFRGSLPLAGLETDRLGGAGFDAGSA
jgi:hypothetical protein